MKQRQHDGKKKKVLILISRGVSDRTQQSNQGRAIALFDAKRVPYDTVDGMDPDQREMRNKLFGVSGIRGNYPQFFFVHGCDDGNGNGDGGNEDVEGEGETKDPKLIFSFIGDWERVEGLNESSCLPADFLAANPSLDTWESIFGDV